jgi:two-component system, cell cycle sensor histidine kinase and response regulator CckA
MARGTRGGSKPRRTLRRRAEEGEERLRAVLTAAGAGFWERDLRTNANIWSDGLWDLYGLKRGEVTPSYEAWLGAVHPEDRARADQASRGAAERGADLSHDYRVLGPDGAVRWLSSRGHPVRNRAGELVRYRGIVFDVTELKRAAELAREKDANDALRQAVEQLPIGVLVVEEGRGATLRVVTFNSAYQRIVGAPVERQSDMERLPYQVYLADRQTLVSAGDLPGPRALRDGDVVRDVRLHVHRSDGTWRAISASAAPTGQGAPGAPRRAVVVMLDVTEREEAEEALRASEARFRDVVASAGEYVFEIDASGNLTYISDAVTSILGHRPEELVGRGAFAMAEMEQLGQGGAVLADALATGVPFSHFQHIARHSSGRPVWLDVSAVPIPGRDGAVRGYRGTAMDVTYRHQAEVEQARLQAQLAQAQKMEVVGRLAGGVAHDFNNLLTVILSCGLELRDTLRQGVPADPELASDVLSAAQRAADLTGQLLAFARKQVVSPEVVDLNDVLRQARKLLGRVIGEDVHVSQQLAEGLWPVLCDRGLVSQVIMNLAVNARDAMPTGGTLTFSTENLTFGPGDPLPDPEAAPGRYVALVVRDTGAGMVPEVLEHVFEPFFTTKEAGVGTGLGLATVYGIVKQSGGFVSVRSAPGDGTLFQVLLPATTPAPAAPAREPSPARGGTETILVVEDEPKVREIIVRVLRSAGYQVLEAASGAEAVDRERLTPGPIHLLLTDVVMPGLGGREAAERILAGRPRTRVLYVSGYTRDAISRRGVLDEGVSFLAKPFKPDDLLQRVRTVLDAG